MYYYDQVKILLIIPRYLKAHGSPNIPHPGIAQLSAVLTANGIENHVADNHLANLEEINDLIRKLKPDILGVTCYSPGYKNAYDLISRIKNEFEDLPLILGGPHVSVTRKNVIRDSQADFAIKNEGEVTLPELLDALSSKKDFQGIKGLIWRAKDGRIIENEDRSFLTSEQLDKLPFADFSKFKIKEYLCYQERLLPLVTSRGCPYLCTYCSVNLTQGRKFRAFSPERSVEEIKLRVAAGWKEFDIHDDCFSLDLARAKKFCDLLIRENLNMGYKFNNGLRADRTDVELLQKLKQSGCRFIAYGLESANQDVLRNIKKRISVDKVKEALAQTHSAGIKTAVNFIIGLQGENYEQALQSIKFASSLKNTSINMANAIPYPGTQFYKWIENNGKFIYEPDDYLNKIGYQDLDPVFETRDFTKAQRLKALKKGFSLRRKRELQQKLGSTLGTLVSYSYNLAPVRLVVDPIFKSNKIGRKFYLKFLRKN